MPRLWADRSGLAASVLTAPGSVVCQSTAPVARSMLLRHLVVLVVICRSCSGWTSRCRSRQSGAEKLLKRELLLVGLL
jgi:hypothetical protein